MILYLKIKKLLDTINSFSNVAGYKINFQTSVIFLYTNNEQIEKEYRKIIPFAIAPSKLKYQEIINNVNDLYRENYKPLRKKSKKITEDGKISHAHELAEPMADPWTSACRNLKLDPWLSPCTSKT
jgi:hypothetical protein